MFFANFQPHWNNFLQDSVFVLAIGWYFYEIHKKNYCALSAYYWKFHSSLILGWPMRSTGMLYCIRGICAKYHLYKGYFFGLRRVALIHYHTSAASIYCELQWYDKFWSYYFGTIAQRFFIPLCSCIIWLVQVKNCAAFSGIARLLSLVLGIHRINICIRFSEQKCWQRNNYHQRVLTVDKPRMKPFYEF